MRYLIALVISVLVIAVAFHFAKPLPDTHFDESFLPRADYVRYLTAGNDASAAGLLWIKGLTDLGENVLMGREYAYLAHVASISTELDSLFFTPYYFVGSMTSFDATDTTDYPVMRRGVRIFPENWRLAICFALRLSRSPYPDKKSAADIMRRYFDSPDTTIPPHIRTIYRSFELDTMQVEMAVSTILQDVLNPRFKAFKSSFYGKTYRALGYKMGRNEKTDEAVFDTVKKIIDMVTEEKMPPQQAYGMLLRLQKKEKIEVQKADTTASIENAPADFSVVDSAAKVQEQ